MEEREKILSRWSKNTKIDWVPLVHIYPQVPETEEEDDRYNRQWVRHNSSGDSDDEKTAAEFNGENPGCNGQVQGKPFERKTGKFA